MSRKYDWDKEGRPGTALFNRVMAWLLACMALASWPLFAVLARDWTLIFLPLLASAGAVMARLMLRQVYSAEPDYAAIARMEHEVYGEAFRHEGAPGPVGFTLPEGWEHVPLKVRTYGLSPDDAARAAGAQIAHMSTCLQGHSGVLWVEGRGRVCPKCDKQRS